MFEGRVFETAALNISQGLPLQAGLTIRGGYCTFQENTANTKSNYDLKIGVPDQFFLDKMYNSYSYL